jgi:hypothetical protein
MRSSRDSGLNFIHSRKKTQGDIELSGPAPLHRLNGWRLNRMSGAGVGRVKANQYLVGRILQTSIRLVQLTGCLAGKLTKLIAVGHLRKCPKNKIRTHYEHLLHHLHCPAGTSWLPRCSRHRKRCHNCLRNHFFQALDARSRRVVQKILTEQSKKRNRLDTTVDAGLQAWESTRPAVPFRRCENARGASTDEPSLHMMRETTGWACRTRKFALRP